MGIGRADVGKHIGAFGDAAARPAPAEFEGLTPRIWAWSRRCRAPSAACWSSIAKAGGMKDGAMNGMLKGLTGPMVAAVRELKKTGKVSEDTFRG